VKGGEGKTEVKGMPDYIFNSISFKEFCEVDKQLLRLRQRDLLHIPFVEEPEFTELEPDWNKKYVTELDGYIAIDEPWKPQNEEEEKELVDKFLSGLRKLLDKESNWTFLQPLLLSLEYCARCQTCSEACPIYVASGRKEIYSPVFRSEMFRQMIKETKGGKRRGRVTPKAVLRLAELAYRCTVCRRCTQACPLGIDNGLITREIRKLFSQEMGIAPSALHMQGTVQQLVDGTSIGFSSNTMDDFVREIEYMVSQVLGRSYRLPVDVKKVDILLIHSIMDYIHYPETIAAMAAILEMAGYEWTLSSKIPAIDAVNYGMWYDDIQLARIALSHIKAARELDVERIVIGESGHTHSTLMSTASRLFADQYPVESYLPLLWKIVRRREIKFDSDINDFPVTLHDPCYLTRFTGIVKPQRDILKEVCPQFREMNPNGVYNYCCGGGGGLAVLNTLNFPDFRARVASRVKMKQIIEAFNSDLTEKVQKYVCAPCSNCKLSISHALNYYGLSKFKIKCLGIPEIVLNCVENMNKKILSVV
jgi:Fe-S oxidoreductase